MSRLALHCEAGGTGDPLTLLHGFTTHGRAWDDIRTRLERNYRVLTIDLPGHGGSPTPPPDYDFAHCVADIVATMNSHDHVPGDLLGYSMGGRIALATAIESPDSIRRLVLESSSPGLADSEARAARHAADAKLADSIETTPLAEFIDRWLDLPLFRTQGSVDQDTRRTNRNLRLDNSPGALAASLRTLGTGSQPSYWDQLPTLDRPTLLVTGALDEKFQDIAREMHERLPDSVRTVIPDAGHTTHLEQPAAFVEAVTTFLVAADPVPKPGAATP